MLESVEKWSLDKNGEKVRWMGFKAYNSKGVDRNGAKCNMGFGRTTKIYLQVWTSSGLDFVSKLQEMCRILCQLYLRQTVGKRSFPLERASLQVAHYIVASRNAVNSMCLVLQVGHLRPIMPSAAEESQHMICCDSSVSPSSVLPSFLCKYRTTSFQIQGQGKTNDRERIYEHVAQLSHTVIFQTSVESDKGFPL